MKRLILLILVVGTLSCGHKRAGVTPCTAYCEGKDRVCAGYEYDGYGGYDYDCRRKPAEEKKDD